VMVEASTHQAAAVDAASGVPPHFGHFQNRWIGRKGPWPPRSPDLTPFCRFVKSLVYAVNSCTRTELLGRIMDASTHTGN
jgi:hypothetical protein